MLTGCWVGLSDSDVRVMVEGCSDSDDGGTIMVVCGGRDGTVGIDIGIPININVRQ